MELGASLNIRPTKQARSTQVIASVNGLVAHVDSWNVGFLHQEVNLAVVHFILD